MIPAVSRAPFKRLRNLREAATIGRVGMQGLVGGSAGHDRGERIAWLAVCGRVQAPERLLHGLEGARACCRPQVDRVATGELVRHEVQLLNVEGAKALAQGERADATFVGQFAWLADAVGFAFRARGDDRLVLGTECFDAALPVEGGPRCFRGWVGFRVVGYDGTGLTACGGAIWPVWVEACVHEAWGDGAAFAMSEKLGCV